MKRYVWLLLLCLFGFAPNSEAEMSAESMAATAQTYFDRATDFLNFDLQIFRSSTGCKSFSCFSYNKKNSTVTIGEQHIKIHPEQLAWADQIEFMAYGTLGVRVVIWPKPVPSLGITRDHYLTAVYGYDPDKGDWSFGFDKTSGCSRYRATPSSPELNVCGYYGNARGRSKSFDLKDTAVADRINILHYASSHLFEIVALASMYRDSHPHDKRLIRYELTPTSGDSASIFGTAYPGGNPLAADWPAGEAKISKASFEETSPGTATVRIYLGSKILAESGSPGQTEPDLIFHFEYDPKGRDFPRFTSGLKIDSASACTRTQFGYLCPTSGQYKTVEYLNSN